jgi:hypothetical protein
MCEAFVVLSIDERHRQALAIARPPLRWQAGLQHDPSHQQDRHDCARLRGARQRAGAHSGCADPLVGLGRCCGKRRDLPAKHSSISDRDLAVTGDEDGARTSV